MAPYILCKCYAQVVAKTLTLALDDRLIERAREYAHSRDLTLNSLIRELLAKAVDPGDTVGVGTTFQLMDEAKPQPSQGTWRREDLYERRKA
jgi:hypothetical protein